MAGEPDRPAPTRARSVGVPSPAATEGLADDSERALAAAYRYIDRRERTEVEVRRHLAGQDFAEPVIELTLAALRQDGYLDDGRFARLFAEEKRELDGWGSGRIARTLLERGVDPELVRSTIARMDVGDELARAVTHVRRRYPDAPDDPRARERALGFLLRKGYDTELALDALAVMAAARAQP